MNSATKKIATGAVALSLLTPNASATISNVTLGGKDDIMESLCMENVKDNKNGNTLPFEEARKQYKDDLQTAMLDDNDDNKKKDYEEIKNNNLEKNKKIQLSGFGEGQTTLYNPLTFVHYSEHPGIHLNGTIRFPFGEKTGLSVSEDLYATLEKTNPNSLNNFTDVVLMHNFNNKISAGAGVELFQYPKQDRGTDSFNVLGIFTYTPCDKLSFNTIAFKPLCSLDGNKNPNFFIIETVDSKISNVDLLLRTFTSCTEKGKTNVSLGFHLPIGDKSSVEFTTIPNQDSKLIQIVPGGAQGTLHVNF